MPKRTPSNTVHSQVKAMLNATAPEFDPPTHVRFPEEARPFWSGIMASRARDEWTKNDFVIAAQLARCQCDIEKETTLLDNEGSVLENARGTPVMNPRHTVLEQLARRELALMRSLAMTSSHKNLSDTGTARKLERNMVKVKDELLEEDNFLAV